MNILYILRHNPWGIGGGCYACRCYLDVFTEVFKGGHFDACICKEYLDDKGCDYDNVSFIGVEQRSKKEKVMSPITGLLHRFDSIARELLKSKKYDYCIFDHNSIAGPLVGLCKRLGVKMIVINHNCESEYYRDNYSYLKRLLFLHHVKSAERSSYLKCDSNIFLTEEDKLLFEERYGKSATKSIVTGCFEFKENKESNDSVNKNAKIRKNEQLKLIISGTIGNVQNMDGINFFLKELLPCVPKKAEVIIAGKNPPANLSEEIKKLNMTGGYARVTLIPNPEDIMSIVNGCDIFLCPTRLGGGLKLRVMDGLKAGLPVVAHQVSARGYSAFAKQGMLWSFKTKEEFEKSMMQAIELLENEGYSKEHIQSFAKEQFSFEEKVKMLKTLFMNK